MPQRFLTTSFLSKFRTQEKSQLEHLLLTVRTNFEAEPKLLALKPGKIMFAGDIHGDFDITQKVITLFQETGCDQLVFLGDYIDRGEEDIENVNFLLHLKVEFPDKIFLLRGNHETSRINAAYGFYDRVIRRYNPFGREIYSLYNYIFSKMPLAGGTSNGVFFSHAGIPEGLETVDDINQIEDEIDPEDSRTFELLWNDPKENIAGFKRNSRGPRSKYFGEDVFKAFLTQNQKKLMIRSHEHFAKGYEYFFDHQLLSIYSSKSLYWRAKPKVVTLNLDGTLQLHDVLHANNNKNHLNA
jgi:hypothetical protein